MERDVAEHFFIVLTYLLPHWGGFFCECEIIIALYHLVTFSAYAYVISNNML